MTSLANKMNAWLTPGTRKMLHAAVALIAAVAAIWGLSTDAVNMWVALVTALGGLGSSVLAAIVTRRADMSVLYSSAAAVIVALVALRFLDPTLAGQIDNTLSAVVAFAGVFAFARTDTSTSTGSPATEVVAGQAYANAYAPLVPPAPAAPSTLVKGNVTTFDPGNGQPTTSTPN